MAVFFSFFLLVFVFCFVLFCCLSAMSHAARLVVHGLARSLPNTAIQELFEHFDSQSIQLLVWYDLRCRLSDSNRLPLCLCVREANNPWHLYRLPPPMQPRVLCTYWIDLMYVMVDRLQHLVGSHTESPMRPSCLARRYVSSLRTRLQRPMNWQIALHSIGQPRLLVQQRLQLHNRQQHSLPLPPRHRQRRNRTLHQRIR
jgi:hypothetical protein